ncbi:MAG TPA: hypothetical protein V6D47_07415 [Oscillatoriaceae cyanobacterium]
MSDSTSPAPNVGARAEFTQEAIDCAIAFALFLIGFWAYGFIDQHAHVAYAYFVPLADAMLHGHLNVVDHPSYMNELVPFRERWYVVYPPGPALVLLPFVWMWGPAMNQGSVSILLGGINLMILYFVLRGYGLEQWKRILFTLLYGFGTIFWFSAQVGTAWHIAQVLGNTFLLLALLETTAGKRAWLMGLFVGCAALSRLPTLMAFPFFLAFLLHETRRRPEALGTVLDPETAHTVRFDWREPIEWRRYASKVFQFGALMAVPLMFYLWYNWARFGSPFQTGYTLIPGLLQEHQYRFGFFSLHNIGRNLYALLLSNPRLVDKFPFAQPCKLGGMSILLSTPAFLWAIKARGWDWLALGGWISVVLISVPMMLHPDPGGLEFGYRYAMDFYPILLLLMLRGMGKRLTFEQGLAIALCFLVNFWGIWAIRTGWWA